MKPNAYLTRVARKHAVPGGVLRAGGYFVGDQRIGSNVRQARSALYQLGRILKGLPATMRAAKAATPAPSAA